MSLDRASALIASHRAGKKPLQDASPDPAALPGIKFSPVPPPACPECHDMGLLIPPGAREATPCPCGALLRNHVERWTVASAIPRQHRQPGGFDRYKPTTAATAKALARCRSFAEAWRPGGPGLVLSGSVGTGKTHLACAVAMQALHAPTPSGFATARFWNVPSLLMEIRATYRQDAHEGEDEIIERAAECDLLILDDLGAERGTDHAHERLYLIINDRLESGRTTVVTTNINLSRTVAGQQFDERLLSRLHAVAPPENTLNLDAPDHRRGPKR